MAPKQIFAHVWSLTASPLLPGVGYAKAPTCSLKEIVESFFLEKKSGGGGNRGFPPPAAKFPKILDFVLGCEQNSTIFISKMCLWIPEIKNISQRSS